MAVDTLAALDYNMYPEIIDYLDSLKVIGRDNGINYSSLAPTQILREIELIKEENRSSITANYSDADKIKLILLFDELNQKDDSYKKMTENIVKNVFNSVTSSREYQKLSEQWVEAYNNDDRNKMDEIFQKYNNKLEKKIKSTYGIELNTKYNLLYIGDNNLRLHTGEEVEIPNTMYGGFVNSHNTNFINLNYGDGTYYNDLNNVNKTQKHELGVHNFYDKLFSLNTNKAKKIVERNRLENYKKVETIVKTDITNVSGAPSNLDIVLYMIQSQEAMARYAEKFR